MGGGGWRHGNKRDWGVGGQKFNKYFYNIRYSLQESRYSVHQLLFISCWDHPIRKSFQPNHSDLYFKSGRNGNRLAI